MTRFHPGIRYLASLVKQAKNPWKSGVSEEGRADRFVEHGRLPAIFHPIEGELTITAARSKIGPFTTRPMKVGRLTS